MDLDTEEIREMHNLYNFYVNLYIKYVIIWTAREMIFQTNNRNQTTIVISQIKLISNNLMLNLASY